MRRIGMADLGKATGNDSTIPSPSIPLVIEKACPPSQDPGLYPSIEVV